MKTKEADLKDKTMIKVILTECDVDYKPDDSDTEETLLAQVNDLNIEWDNNGPVEELKQQEMIKLYEGYHSKTAENYKNKINE